MTERNIPIKVRPEIANIPVYKQGARPVAGGFKLSSNESPFTPLPAVLKAVQNRTDLNRYADPSLTVLRETLAANNGLPGADWVHISAGSVHILYQLIQTVCGPQNNYVHAWPSFEAYPLLGAPNNCTAIGVPLRPDATHDLPAMLAAINDDTRAVLLCTPNNPTGPTIKKSEFDEFIAQVPSDLLVVVDEAYIEFNRDEQTVQGAEELHRHSNVVVLRTFSKAYGLAGLRLGYGLADPGIWRAMSAVVVPLSVSGIAESAALAALEPESLDSLNEQITAIQERLDALRAGLEELGLELPASESNFIWIPAHQLPQPAAGSEISDPAQALGAYCASEHNILIRPFAGHGLRITAGEAESVPAVIAAISEYLQANRGGANG
ncbi:MAG: aminotransferase class I/II-fold pyridoxal phosphate-dependent enzyme [Microbacteriaceae bacterium]|nr:aminotransferase class I/II-fold pyridoxal phosphate-dependent enzyme [Microbacteriaceae bacterium]